MAQDEEVRLKIEETVNEATSLTMEYMLEHLKDIIQEDVYGWESPSNAPWDINRTWQFLNSWQTYESGNDFIISQDIETMKQIIISGVVVHHDREKLAGILDKGEGFQFGEREGDPSNFWEHFTSNFVAIFDKKFRENCNKLGLDFN